MTQQSTNQAATLVILDPTSERSPATIRRPPRLTSLSGVAVGLLDIAKPRGDVFLDRLEAKLVDAGAVVKRYRKPTFTRPAPVNLRQRIATECGAVVEALAD